MLRVRRRFEELWADLAADERGASPVEFVLVGTVLTALTLAILQLGLAVYVRNVVHDAAVEGAFHAALADTSPADGAERTRTIVAHTVGSAYAGDVSVREAASASGSVVEVTVRTTLPLLGLWGIPQAMEVTGRAPLESLD